MVKQELLEQYGLCQERIPGHVAIIMDGNGRWAKARHMPRTYGHKKGAERVLSLIHICMRKPSVSLVLGGGHSIGVPMAVSADYSFIAPTASMTVHPLRSNGLFITSQESFAYFLKMQERIINFIADNAKIDAKQVQTLMNNKNQLVDDIGTVLTLSLIHIWIRMCRRKFLA